MAADYATSISASACISLFRYDKKVPILRYFSFYGTFLFLLRITGLEPARDAHWYLKPARLPIPPYPHFLFHISVKYFFIKTAEILSKDFRCFNEASGIRTPDNLIKSQVLYQLS